MLTRSMVSREFFAQEIISILDRNHSGALSLFSHHQQLLREILPAIGIATDQRKTNLLVKALLEQHRNASCTLRTICAPEAASAFEHLGKCKNESQIVGALKGLKHVGFSSDGKTVLDLAKEQYGPVRKYLAANPLRQAQVAKAKSEAKRRVPDTKQAAWREVEAESAFNYNLLEKSREAQQKSVVTQRSVFQTSNNIFKQKTRRNTVMLSTMYIYLYKKVQEMLDE